MLSLTEPHPSPTLTKTVSLSFHSPLPTSNDFARPHTTFLFQISYFCPLSYKIILNAILRFPPLYFPSFLSCSLSPTTPPPRFPWPISSSIVTRVSLSTPLMSNVPPDPSLLARYGQLASSSAWGWRCWKDCSGSTSMSGSPSLAPMCLLANVHSPSSL